MYYTSGAIYKWDEYMLARFIDFCYQDKISKLEIVNMAKGLKLHVDGTTFWCLEINHGH